MNYKKLGFVFLALMIVSVLAVSIVSAAGNSSGTSTSASGSAVGAFKQLWNAFFGGIFPASFSIGTYEVGITQFLLMILVVLFVYSIMGFIPFVPRGKIQWLFAVIIGLLAFLFVNAETINSIGTTYQALGIALVSVIPLLVLLGFSIKMNKDDNMRAWAPFFDKFVFLIFGIWMILKWTSSGSKLSDYSVAYLASALIALLWIFAGKIIKHFMSREAEKGKEGADLSNAENYALTRMRNKRAELMTRRTELSSNLSNDALEEKSKLNKQIIQIDKDIKEFVALKQG